MTQVKTGLVHWNGTHFEVGLDRLLAPAPQLGAVHAEVQPITHAHDEAGSVAAQCDAAGGAATSEGARLEDGVAGAAGHGEDEHGGRVA